MQALLLSLVLLAQDAGKPSVQAAGLRVQTSQTQPSSAPQWANPEWLNGLYREATIFTREGNETVGVFEPLTSTQGAALVVHFHAYEGGPGELTLLSPVAQEFLKECALRNWYLISPAQAVGSAPGSAPPGMNGATYGNALARARVDIAVEWALRTFPHIDPDRIYGFGFSMGGGDCLSYAAHRRDPNGIRFAALAVNDPTAALNVEWEFHGPNSTERNQIERAMGAGVPWISRTPVQAPFDYERASTLWASFNNNIVTPDASRPNAILNLTAVPLAHFYSNEPRFAGVGAWLDVAHPSPALFTASGHAWARFDVSQVFSLFDATLAPVTRNGGMYEVVHGRRYDDVTVHALDPSRLTSLTQRLLSAPNGLDTLDLSFHENVERIEFDGVPHGFLAPMKRLEVEVRSSNGQPFPSGHTIEITTLSTAGSPSVTLNGAPVTAPNSWALDPATGILTLAADGSAASFNWLIQ